MRRLNREQLLELFLQLGLRFRLQLNGFQQEPCGFYHLLTLSEPEPEPESPQSEPDLPPLLAHSHLLSPTSIISHTFAGNFHEFMGTHVGPSDPPGARLRPRLPKGASMHGSHNLHVRRCYPDLWDVSLSSGLTQRSRPTPVDRPVHLAGLLWGNMVPTTFPCFGVFSFGIR